MLVLAPLGRAFAQDKPAAETAKKAAPEDGAEAEEPEKPKGIPLPKPFPGFLDANTIRRTNGNIVRFYTVNSVDPKLVIDELNRWKTKAGSVVLIGAPTRLQKDRVEKSAVQTQTVVRIEDTEENWAVLERVLAIVDVAPPQVYVEAKIVEISMDDQMRIGIDNANVRTDRPVGDLFFKRIDATFANQIATDVVSRVAFGSADKFVKFDYVLQLGKSGSQTEVLSTPGILASVGEQAIINVGAREPIVKQTISGTNVTAATTFEDIGLKLTVLPLMIGRDHVRASIEPEVSRVSEFRTTSTSNDRDVINPVISTRNAKTVVTVPDGETVVISGLQQTAKLEEKRGIPILRDIPLVGGIFGSTTEREQKTELVIFVTLTIRRGNEGRLIVPPSEVDRVAK